MEIRVLQYFLAVAREENITRAAKNLHMTQPTLSRQLKDLENELGKQLFIRGNKKITLTDDGILLRKRAEELTDLMEKTKNEIMTSDYDISGDIYIGCGESGAISYLAEAACNLQSEYPDIHYCIYSGDAERVTEKLDKGLIDFGLFVATPSDIEKYNYIRLPKNDTWGILMKNDSELAQKKYICAKDLWDKPLIVSHQASKDNELFKQLQKNEEELNIVMKYDLIFNASHFVKKGFGYLIGLNKLVNTSGNSNLCFRPFYPTWESELFIVWKKYQILSKPAEKFLEAIHDLLNT